MRSNQREDEVSLHTIPDALRGNLYIGEAKRQIPFPIKRFYVIADIPGREVVRGGHAHKTMEQAMFCIRGSCLVRLDDGKKKWEVRLRDPSKGLLIRSRVWHDFTDCPQDTLVLMVASDHYDEAEYIRDYHAFTEFIRAKH